MTTTREGGGTRVEAEKLRELMRLMDEAYDHYFDLSDGHCKSSEGAVSINFGTYFDRNEGAKWNEVTGVEVYSYVLGPSRSHYFDSIDDALEAVRGWHKAEMDCRYEEQQPVETPPEGTG